MNEMDLSKMSFVSEGEQVSSKCDAHAIDFALHAVGLLIAHQRIQEEKGYKLTLSTLAATDHVLMSPRDACSLMLVCGLGRNCYEVFVKFLLSTAGQDKAEVQNTVAKISQDIMDSACKKY